MIQTMSKGAGPMNTALFGMLYKAVFGSDTSPGLLKIPKPGPLIHAFGILPKRKVTPKMLAVQARKAAQRKRTADGQKPKAKAAPRQRKPADVRHDGAGFAFTLVGQDPRRVWLGGISAQRGF